jgi:hypothetical protein
VPLSAVGKLSIVTSSDLGALGSKEGLPVTYNWVLPSVAPLLLPWLVILGLLALKPNRCAAAWLIWLPLGCVIAFTLAPPDILPSGTNFFLDVIAALAVGLAAVWLLSNYLRRQHRFVTFLCILPALAGFSALAHVSRQGWSFTPETLVTGITLAVGVLASAGAAAHPAGRHLAGDCPAILFICADRFRRKASVERILCSRLRGGGAQFRDAAAVLDPVVGQSVLPRTAQGVAARQTGNAALDCAFAGGQFINLHSMNKRPIVTS